MQPEIQELMDAWKAKDDARARSRQRGVGMSSLGGCARRVHYELTGADRPNHGAQRRLGSLLGTAFHTEVESLGLPGETELAVEVGGVPGHLDRFYEEYVRDWKFTKKSTIEWIKKQGVSRQYRWQIQTYALALSQQGYKVKGCKIIYIPKDGDEEDCYVWTEPFDPQIAQDALNWLEVIRRAGEQGYIPQPEKHASFCAKYCPFYGLCPGGDNKDEEELPVEKDPWLEEAARTLWAAGQNIKMANQVKEQAAGVLEGFSGRLGKFKVVQRRSRYGVYPYVTKAEE